jgi:PAS domain S-box-containing protein
VLVEPIIKQLDTMPKKSTWPTEAGAILRIALLRNHLQEQKDTLAAQEQARQALLARHRQELAHISLLTQPLGWAMAIQRYTRQLLDLHLRDRHWQRAIKLRQEQERAQLEAWLSEHPLVPHQEALFFDQLQALLNWSLSKSQRQAYHQALSEGNTLVVTDVTKTILWASQRFWAMTGYRPLEAVGKTPAFLQGPATDRAEVRRIHERLSRGEAFSTELVNYRKNGEPYRCHLSVEPLYTPQGELTHFIAIEYEVKP